MSKSGRGRFSVVKEGVHKRSGDIVEFTYFCYKTELLKIGQHVAVKIIEKASMEPEEKQLLRTEIAGSILNFG